MEVLGHDLKLAYKRYLTLLLWLVRNQFGRKLRTLIAFETKGRLTVAVYVVGVGVMTAEEYAVYMESR